VSAIERDIRVGGEVSAANDRLYRAGDNWLICWDSNTGKKIWQVDFKQANDIMITATDGKVVVLPNERWVAAYDAATGKRLWKTTVKLELEFGRIGLAISPSYAYLIGLDGTIVVLEKASGERVWQSDSLGSDDDALSPSIMFGGLYLAAGQRVYRFEGSRS
jgi:outer membrane protein assembly factor BamB